MLLRRLAVVLGALVAVGLATVEPHAAAVSGTGFGAAASSRAVAGVTVVPLLIDAAMPCPVATGSVIGPCPRPLVSRSPVPRGPIVMLCPRSREIPFMNGRPGQASVCGVGFHANDRVDVIVQARYGSTMWRVATDFRGGFRSSLPWPSCALTPGKMFAVDLHNARSNAVQLPGRGCP